MTRALLVIDVQNDFCEPNGSLKVTGSSEIIPIINKLKNSNNFDLVIHTLDWHPVNHCSFITEHPGKNVFDQVTLPSGKTQTLWPVHCIQYSVGSALHPQVVQREKDIFILKGSQPDLEMYSGFGVLDANVRTPLEETLRANNVSQIFLCGLATDYCVGSTALDGACCGFEVFVLEDACRGVAKETSDEMIHRAKEVGVKFVQSESVL